MGCALWAQECLGTQFTCFTSTKVQIMTPEELRASLVVAIDDVHFGLFEKMDANAAVDALLAGGAQIAQRIDGDRDGKSKVGKKGSGKEGGGVGRGRARAVKGREGEAVGVGVNARAVAARILRRYFFFLHIFIPFVYVYKLYLYNRYYIYVYI